MLDIALCFGWIDGRRNALDDDLFLQRFTPRRARSRWSRINREKAEALIAAGTDAPRRPGGGRAREGRRALGRGLRGPAHEHGARRPAARARHAAEAAEFFAGLSSQNRYAILYRLHDAKRPETRARRLEKFVAMLEAGETIY